MDATLASVEAVLEGGVYRCRAVLSTKLPYGHPFDAERGHLYARGDLAEEEAFARQIETFWGATAPRSWRPRPAPWPWPRPAWTADEKEVAAWRTSIR